MKTLTGIIFLFALAVLSSCEGPVGPPGQDGESLFGTVFQFQDDFTPENEYSLYYEFPQSITVYETDVVLVYIRWKQVEDNSGETVDVWRLLPQTVDLGDRGILQYNYDYTFNDVEIFLDGTVDFNTLPPADTDNQAFRIVVFPADFITQKGLDINDYNLMMKSLKVTPGMIQKIDVENKNEVVEP